MFNMYNKHCCSQHSAVLNLGPGVSGSVHCVALENARCSVHAALSEPRPQRSRLCDLGEQDRAPALTTHLLLHRPVGSEFSAALHGSFCCCLQPHPVTHPHQEALP